MDAKRFLKNIFWSPIRAQLILRRQLRVENKWRPIVEKYFLKDLKIYPIKEKVVLPDNVIWQYWDKGFDTSTLPSVVKLATQTVDKYAKGYTIIRLSDDNLSDYLDIPIFLLRKYQQHTISKAHYSDIVRLLLISTYGGLWLDATVMLSAPLPDYVTSQSFFMYQRDIKAQYKNYWRKSYAAYWGWNKSFRVRCLNAIYYSQKGDEVTECLKDLMLYYWENNSYAIDYFFFQILFNLLISEYFQGYNCQIVDDTLPHRLHNHINGNDPSMFDVDETLALSSVHKLTYFDTDGVQKLRDILNARKIL